MTVVHKHRVRCHEVDAQGILFNSRYWEIADAAMVEYFRALGWSYPQLVAAGMDAVLVHCSARFRRRAALDDELDVDVTPTQLGSTSLTLRFELRAVGSGHEIAELTIVYVNIDSTTGQKYPIPDDVRERLGEAVREDLRSDRDRVMSIAAPTRTRREPSP